MNLRSKFLSKAYDLFPFHLKGDAEFIDNSNKFEISCLINFYARTDLLRIILTNLSEQVFSKDKFEVILVEDRGGTYDGKSISEEFASVLNIRYFTLTDNFGKMGYSRNYALSKSTGKFILFLDDDTVIMQNNFLSDLIKEIELTGADAVVPYGRANYCLLKGRYDYHEPFFPSNRCMVYRRDVLTELGGFISDMIGQEDVEFFVRFTVSGKKIINSIRINYFHPPLIVNNIKKPAAVGKSFAKLRGRYPLLIWLMLLANGCRYLPLLLFPVYEKFKMQGRFSLGFFLGILYAVIGKEVQYS